MGGFILGALVNEFSDLCPWLARGVVRWAACRWTSDSTLALSYAEEWVAVIDARPGKLLKLFTGPAGGRGGFAILYRDTSQNAVRAHVSETLQALSHPIQVYGSPIALSVSCGLAFAHRLGDFAELYQSADSALLQARRQGKPLVTFGRDVYGAGFEEPGPVMA